MAKSAFNLISQPHLRLVLLLCLLACGCNLNQIDTTYGKRRGFHGGKSVNGTAVLSDLFVAKGHRVATWRRLSPKLFNFQVIVWFDVDYAVPTSEQREYLERWLSEGGDRTLVYVGRDFDAAIAYWQAMKKDAPDDEYLEVSRRAAVTRSAVDLARDGIPEREAADWFVLEGRRSSHRAESLQGEWSEGIDTEKSEIEVGASLVTPDEDDIQTWATRTGAMRVVNPQFEVLLSDDDTPLVTRISSEAWQGGQILLVANGSFLLNLPLINHEHRKLAGRLVDACGPPDRVVFLESEAGGPVVFDVEPSDQRELPWPAWLVCVFQIQMVLPLIILCAALFPIFGKARAWEVPNESDFGKHVAALGEMLELAGDRPYAFKKMKYYHRHVKRESAAAQLRETESNS